MYVIHIIIFNRLKIKQLIVKNKYKCWENLYLLMLVNNYILLIYK